MALKPRELALLAAEAAEDKKARDVLIFDMRSLTPVTDYFLICSGNTTNQVKVIAEHIEEKLKEVEVNPLHREGYRNARWILLDYGDVVIHVFHEFERGFYNLERLWGDAEVVLASHA